MRHVTTQTTSRLDHRVLIYKRPGRIGVALGADRILIRGSEQLAILKRSMRIVAVRALHQPLDDLVVEGHVELRLHVAMAGETKLRLVNLQQARRGCGVVHAVATRTTDPRLCMLRLLEVCMLSGMAGQAGHVHLLWRKLVEPANLGDISAAVDVLFPGSVATFTRCSGTAMFCCNIRVRVRGEFIRHLRMASRTGLRSDIVGRISLSRCV